jgi:hypothetical protein
MIIRRTDSTLQLITQPAHAALSARIMREWASDHFPDTPRKPSILHAVEQHDCGWAEFDQELIFDTATGYPLDFTEVPDDIKRATSVRCVLPLASDPYAAALSAQHRLHVYRRYAEDSAWTPFFAEIAAMRDAHLRASGAGSLDELLRDYRFVRAGDLASLAFCNEWPDTPDDGCGYSMKMDGDTLTITPDPFGGRTIDIDITARVIANLRFGSAAEAREARAAARVVTLKGIVRGPR